MKDAEDPREITEAAALRALAHLLRQQMLRRLNRDGPATSTSIAQALGQNTGTTSYHLRQLAQHGFIEEVPGKGHGRERWWQARKQDMRFTARSRMDADAQAAFDQFGRLGIAEDLNAFERFQQQRDELGEWGDALVFSRGALRLNPEQLLQFWKDYMELLKRYQTESDQSDAARRVLLRFVAFPDV